MKRNDELTEAARLMESARDQLQSSFSESGYQEVIGTCVKVLRNRMESTHEPPLLAAINVARLPGMGLIAKRSYLAAGVEMVCFGN